MQLPGSATLTNPISRVVNRGRLTRLRLYHLLVLGRSGRVGLISLVLSYWEKLFNR